MSRVLYSVCPDSDYDSPHQTEAAAIKGGNARHSEPQDTKDHTTHRCGQTQHTVTTAQTRCLASCRSPESRNDACARRADTHDIRERAARAETPEPPRGHAWLAAPPRARAERAPRRRRPCTSSTGAPPTASTAPLTRRATSGSLPRACQPGPRPTPCVCTWTPSRPCVVLRLSYGGCGRRLLPYAAQPSRGAPRHARVRAPPSPPSALRRRGQGHAREAGRTAQPRRRVA